MGFMSMTADQYEDYVSLVETLSQKYPEVNGQEFYQQVFPDNEMTGELGNDYSRPNAIYLYKPNGVPKDGQRKLRRRIMLADTWEKDYGEYVEKNELTLCSGLAYRGRANKLANARQMNALIIDLDGVGMKELQNLFLRFQLPASHIRSMPVPTYLVVSGTGVHLYYVLREPLALFPYIKIQAKNLKYDLTFRVWEYGGTSKLKEVQYQSINQGFRMVGSINNKYGVILRAFRTGEKITVDTLNQYCDDESHQVDTSKKFSSASITLAEAKQKYPEWFERRVVRGESRGHWICSRAVYKWWCRQIPKVVGGHRYFFLMCLVIYACKCGISKDELKDDMDKMFDQLKKIQHDNVFTQEDVSSALEMYDREFYRFPIDDIEKVSGIRIEKNKRNYRPQALHLARIRKMQEVDYPDGEWRNKDGRPITKDKVVIAWRQQHPSGNKADCIRDTGLSRPTVAKYWNIKV